jgi:hypothetical protein
MKAEFNEKGELVILPESETEKFSLLTWSQVEDGFIRQGNFADYQIIIPKSHVPDISNKGAEAIIKLTEEKCELERGIGDMLLFIIEAKKGILHTSLRNGNPTLRHLFGIIIDNFDKIKDWK